MILHVGMHKTGTSSIQHALSHALADDRFRLVRLGGLANGSLIMGNAYAEIDGYPHDPTTPLALRRQARRNGMKIITTELNAFDDKIPILSAELICSLGAEAKRAFLDMVSRYYPDVRVAAYVRAPRSYVESAYQERLKHAFLTVDDLVVNVAYRAIFAPFDEALGRDAVSIRLFDAAHLHEGDVVADFAAVWGIAIDRPETVRENEALSAEAVRLLYMYRLFHPAFTDADTAVFALLSTLDGEKFTFRRSVADRAAAIGPEDIEWANGRLNVPIPAEPAADDHGVARDADMLSVRPETIDALARRLGVRPSALSGGPAAIAEALAAYRNAA